MIVKLRCLSIYRQFLPPEAADGEIEVDVSPGMKATDLLQRYGIPVDRSSVILVNGVTPKQGDQLQEGDSIFVFPAIAGG
jgi:sulfur carrier protein ThiS